MVFPRTPRFARTMSAVAVAFVALAAPLARAQLTPTRLYFGVDQRVMVDVAPPPGASDGLVIRLHDPASGEVIAETSCASGEVDLAGLFPRLWSDADPRVLCAQLYAGTEAIGSPLIVQPLVTPDTATMIDPSTLAPTEGASGIPVFESTARRLRAVRTGTPPTPREVTFSGLRVYPDRVAVFHTDFGDMTFRLRPEAAPNTAFEFARLVEGGFYTDIPVHRIVDRLGDGSRFIVQAGDPTATGLGGPGFYIDMEQSALPHDYGVLSLSRGTGVNTGGSQFFICLGRAGTSALDGRYTAFGELVEGVETLERIAARPVDDDDRPLEAVMITGAELVDAPPVPERPRRVRDPRFEPAPVQPDER